MSKAIPIFLWVVALAMLAVLMYARAGRQAADRLPNFGQDSHPQREGDPPGAIMADIPWKYFPDVPQFSLVDQNDTVFDSSVLSGKPYLVSFFFSTCPDICVQLNNQIDRLNDQLKKEEVVFVSISVDPENDTPAVLGRYAANYDADPKRWAFLTGQKYQIDQLGSQVFGVVVDKATHTDNILLVDQWGRYRDRFKWDDPYDMKRLVTVIKDLAAEQEPPLDVKIHTRNVLAGQPPMDLNEHPWVREFHLTERSGETFYSRDLTGEVWIANFFFASCPGICKKQNAYLAGLRERLGKQAPTIVSITTDPTNDTPSVLRSFAKDLKADDRWLFCTGDDLLIRRISSEFFNAHVSDGHHSSLLFVVDRWHRVRGSFDWQKPEEEIAMLDLVEELRVEGVPRALPAKPKSEQIEELDDEQDEDFGVDVDSPE